MLGIKERAEKTIVPSLAVGSRLPIPPADVSVKVIASPTENRIPLIDRWIQDLIFPPLFMLQTHN
jgi:hypothetical protein